MTSPNPVYDEVVASQGRHHKEITAEVYDGMREMADALTAIYARPEPGEEIRQ